MTMRLTLRIFQVLTRALRQQASGSRDERLARCLDEGYLREAERPSLDAEWSAIETEGL